MLKASFPCPLNALTLIFARCGALIIKQLRLEISGIKVKNLKQAQEIIKDFLAKKKAAAIIKFNADLLQAKEHIKDTLLNWGAIIKNK